MQSIHWSKTKLSGLHLSKRRRGEQVNLPDWRCFLFSFCWANATCNFSVGGKAQEILDMSMWMLLALWKVLLQPTSISFILNGLRSSLTDLVCMWNLPPPFSRYDSCCSKTRQHHCSKWLIEKKCLTLSFGFSIFKMNSVHIFFYTQQDYFWRVLFWILGGFLERFKVILV